MTALGVIVAVLMLAGLVGAVVPFIPGTPLVFAGALVYAIATEFTPVGAGRLVILAVLGAAGWAIEHIAGAMGARRAGGGRAAVVGALLGALAGLAFARSACCWARSPAPSPAICCPAAVRPAAYGRASPPPSASWSAWRRTSPSRWRWWRCSCGGCGGG